MRLEKAQIIQMLTNRGDVQQARVAQDVLPDLVDTREHLALLTSVGVDVQHLDGSSDDELQGGQHSPPEPA